MPRRPLVVTVSTDGDIEPIPVLLQDVKGTHVGTFRFHPQPRLDLIALMANTVTLNRRGDRVVDPTILTHVMEEMLMAEVWSTHLDDDERDAAVEAMRVAHAADPDEPEPPDLPGWLRVDDKARFVDVIQGDRYLINIQDLGAIVQHVMIEITGHPTGGSLPYVPGPGSMQPGSTERPDVRDSTSSGSSPTSPVPVR
jgi:hypothetical protein